MTEFPEDTRPIAPVTQPPAQFTAPPTAPLASVPAVPQKQQRVRKRRQRSPKIVRQVRRALTGRFQPIKILAIILAVIAVIVVGVLVLVSDATNRVETSIASLSRVAGSITGRPGTELTLNDFTRIQSAVDDLTNTLSAVQGRLAFLRPLAERVPETTALFTSMDAAGALAQAGKVILSGLQPTVFFLVAGEDDESLVAQISSGQRLVELLRLGRPSFLSAQAQLAAADVQIAELLAQELSTEALLNAEQLATYSRQIAEINTLLINAPDLLTVALGLNEEQSYLVLAHNSDEIRPPGGYLSTYGWFTVRNGRIEDYSYSATTATSPNPPPESFGNQVQVPTWWINFRQPLYAAWDGSWDVDFPSTAARAMWYYNNGDNPQAPVDGVIAIDMIAFESILAVLGEVEVPGYDESVTIGNFREVVYDIRASGEGDSPHKRFLAALYRQIFSEWQQFAATPETSADMLGVLVEMVQERHVMLAFVDPQLSDAVALLGWDGRQRSGAGQDYLLVADANLGNKSNRSIIRQTTYDVQIRADGSVESRLSLIYDYSASRADSDPAVNPGVHGSIDYNNLFQIFAPVGAQLASNTPNLSGVQTVPEMEHTRFVSRFTLPFDRSERFQFTYTTPNVVTSVANVSRYRLTIQKQAGIQPDVVSVQIALPVGAALISATPAASATYTIESQTLLEYRLELNTDIDIDVLFSPPPA